MKKWMNIFLTIGAVCAALADAGNIVPEKVHGYLTVAAVVAGVLAKSPLFKEDNNENK